MNLPSRLMAATALALLAACQPDTDQDDARQAFRVALEAQLADHAEPIRSFYAERSYQPLWLRLDAGWLQDSDWSDEARQLADAVSQAHTHGLPASRYGPDDIAQWLDAPPPDDTNRRAEVERELTQRYLTLASDLTRGRFDADTRAPAWHIARPAFSPGAALASLEESGVAASLAAMPPQSEAYAHLRRARPRLKRIIEAGDWPALHVQGLIQPGDAHAAIPDLRKRLAIEGDLDNAEQAQVADDPTLYDDATVQAFIRFQRRHGIEPDGIVGEEALAMLGYTAAQRLEQVDANLERLRWLPRDLGADRIMVNIAAYVLDAYRGHEQSLSMPVIVGEEQHQTPAFDDRLAYVEINPYWTVPNSIIVNEMAHKIAADPHYLAERNMIVQADWPLDAEIIDPASIDWQRYSTPDARFPFVLRQKPGPDNALGRIKFMFPNQFSIYLHDTPAQHLFDEADRTFSHGCIRVADPLALSDLVFAHTDGWDRSRVAHTIESGEHTRVNLAEADRLPVYIYYSTAWVDADGTLHFRPDRYERDASLMLAFRRARSQTPATRTPDA